MKRQPMSAIGFIFFSILLPFCGAFLIEYTNFQGKNIAGWSLIIIGLFVAAASVSQQHSKSE
ncbi:hypothetical protein [uncultured Kocuria sp.]|uniref:hypothetical protein n=1 Tax=uncultured Kocuria sp. TaxID=259305 RepID=UPI00263210FE|nr:hypothetical protein [uncultured Kocuria sp.]